MDLTGRFYWMYTTSFLPAFIFFENDSLKATRKSGFLFPRRKGYRLDEANTHFLSFGIKQNVERLFNELGALDETIFAYNEQLEKAQPLFSGRILVKFSNRCQVKIGDEFLYDKSPSVGKMIRRPGGTWIFVWIKKVDLSKLADIRTGKGIKGDRVVKKLLKSLGEMLIMREEIISEIKKNRMRFSNFAQSVSFMQSKKMSLLLDLASEIDDDWSVDAKELFSKLATKHD